MALRDQDRSGRGASRRSPPFGALVATFVLQLAATEALRGPVAEALLVEPIARLVEQLPA